MQSASSLSPTGSHPRPGVERLRTLLSENTNSTVAWDRAWQEHTTPWDYGRIQPPLAEALKAPAMRLPANARILVPGCGRGYDAIAIASMLDCRAIGIDVSPAAIEAATVQLKASKTPSLGSVIFNTADFFTYTVPDIERFDLIYDYTFFCAIAPQLRDAWGKQVSKLTKAGAYLITLVYPMDGPREGGPPYSLNVDMYVDALGSQWIKVLDKAPDESSLDHIGRERLVIWRKTDRRIASSPTPRAVVQ